MFADVDQSVYVERWVEINFKKMNSKNVKAFLIGIFV